MDFFWEGEIEAISGVSGGRGMEGGELAWLCFRTSLHIKFLCNIRVVDLNNIHYYYGG